jgi:hypothetical protein
VYRKKFEKSLAANGGFQDRQTTKDCRGPPSVVFLAGSERDDRQLQEKCEQGRDDDQ